MLPPSMSIAGAARREYDDPTRCQALRYLQAYLAAAPEYEDRTA